jgi:hypothetical protein
MRLAFDNSVINLLNETAAKLFDESFAKKFAQRFNNTLDYSFGSNMDMRRLIEDTIVAAVKSEVDKVMDTYHFPSKIYKHCLEKSEEVMSKVDKYVNSVDIEAILIKAIKKYLEEKLK